MIRNKICVVCGLEFAAKSNKAKYCKTVCNDAAYKKRNPDKVKKRRNTWYDKNRDVQNEYKRDKMREWNRVYWAERRKNDINFKLKNNLRNRINSALRGKDRKLSIFELVGCSLEDLKRHIESLFLKDMTWDNHTKFGWHIDHIKPLSSFDLSDSEQLKQACHYTNLQPLWWKDNLQKGDKS